MQEGYFFLCDSQSVTKCMLEKRFSCLNKEQANASRRLDYNSVVFLLNDEIDSLLGPFTVVKGPENLEKGTWYSSVQKDRFSENIEVTWEGLHELKNARVEFPFLANTKNCSLSTLETQELLEALKDAPLFFEEDSGQKQD